MQEFFKEDMLTLCTSHQCTERCRSSFGLPLLVIGCVLCKRESFVTNVSMENLWFLTFPHFKCAVDYYINYTLKWVRNKAYISPCWRCTTCIYTSQTQIRVVYSSVCVVWSKYLYPFTGPTLWLIVLQLGWWSSDMPLPVCGCHVTWASLCWYQPTSSPSSNPPPGGVALPILSSGQCNYSRTAGSSLLWWLVHTCPFPATVVVHVRPTHTASGLCHVLLRISEGVLPSAGAAPALTAVVRGLSGRHCWHMQLRMKPCSSQVGMELNHAQCTHKWCNRVSVPLQLELAVQCVSCR